MTGQRRRDCGDRRDPEQRFADLWRDHAPAVLRYARRRVVGTDVDEVVAETFLVAWRRLDEVPDVPLPWLLGVARGVAANLRRSARRRESLHERLAAQPIRLDQDSPDRSEPPPIGRALERLSVADRELLTLLAWDGLTHEQAADALGCSRGALAVRLHRARRRLRRLLEEADVAVSTEASGPAITGGRPRPDALEASAP